VKSSEAGFIKPCRIMDYYYEKNFGVDLTQNGQMISIILYWILLIFCQHSPGGAFILRIFADHWLGGGDICSAEPFYFAK